MKTAISSRESAFKIDEGKGTEVTRKIARKSASAKPAAPAPAKVVEMQITIIIDASAGAGDTRTYEEFRDDIKAALTDQNGSVRAKRVTNSGGYYLVNGRVCMPGDYDETTRDFKKGAHPPLWAMASDEVKVLQRIEREKSGPGLAKNPEGLRTTKETDEFHKLDNSDRRKAETKKVLDDLHENSDWGKQKKAEQEEAAKFRAKDDDGYDEDEEPWDAEDEEVEDPWDEDDPFSEDVAEEALEEQTSSVLARLRSSSNGSGKTTTRKTTLPAAKTTAKRVVKRR